MKRQWLLYPALLFILAVYSHAQNGNTLSIRFAGVPSGTCAPFMLGINNSNGDLYDCTSGGAWNKVSGGGGGTVTSVTGTPNQIDVATGTTTPVLSLSSTLVIPGTITATAYSTNSSNGGINAVEGTGAGLTAASGVDLLWPDSTAHRWRMNNNNGTSSTIPGVAAAGTSAHLVAFAANGIDLIDGGAAPATGADVALDNLSGVAINTALLPGTDNSIALGSSTKRWSNLFGTTITCGVGGTTSCVITGSGSTSGTATITWPATAGTVTNPFVFSNGIQIPVGTTAAASLSFAGIAAGSGLSYGGHTANVADFSGVIGACLSGNGSPGICTAAGAGGTGGNWNVRADTGAMTAVGAFPLTTTGAISGGNFRATSTQTTVSCSTSGTVVFSQPQQGSSYKLVSIFASACLGTASYTYPVAFTNTPQVLSQTLTAVATSVSNTAVTITGSTTTGFLDLDGF